MYSKNVFNYDSEEDKGEFNALPSLTYPDMVMPLRDMITRTLRGQEVNESHLYYDDDFPNQDFVDPRSLDLLDLQERRELLQERADILEEYLKSKKNDFNNVDNDSSGVESPQESEKVESKKVDE